MTESFFRYFSTFGLVAWTAQEMWDALYREARWMDAGFSQARGLPIHL